MAISSAQAALFFNPTKLTIIYFTQVFSYYITYPIELHPNYVPVHYNIFLRMELTFLSPFALGLVLLFSIKNFIILCVWLGSAWLWFGTNSHNGACIEDSILYPWGNSKGQLVIGLHVERVLLWATGCALKWSIWIEEGSVGRGGGVILGIMEILKSRGVYHLIVVCFVLGCFLGVGCGILFFPPIVWFVSSYL